MADQHDVVEAYRLNALQALARFGWRALERDRAGVRGRATAPSFRADVGVDIRQYRALAAVCPENLHAGFQIFPFAVQTRGDPSAEFTRGALYRLRVAPSAEKYRWPSFSAGPGEENPCDVVGLLRLLAVSSFDKKAQTVFNRLARDHVP